MLALTKISKNRWPYIVKGRCGNIFLSRNAIAQVRKTGLNYINNALGMGYLQYGHSYVKSMLP